MKILIAGDFCHSGRVAAFFGGFASVLDDIMDIFTDRLFYRLF